MGVGEHETFLEDRVDSGRGGRTGTRQAPAERAIVACLAVILSVAWILVSTPRTALGLSKSEIQGAMINIIYCEAGGHVTCDFHGYAGSNYHEGIDFQLRYGAEICSMIDGEVIRVTNATGSNLSTCSIYDAAHDKSVIYLHGDYVVSVGDRVSQGQVIGTEADHGRVTGEHCHIEVRDGWQKSAAVSNDTVPSNDDPYPYWEEIVSNQDTTPPSISEFRIDEINGSTFTALAKVTDNSGVASVRYAVWTDKGGQDDLIWYDAHCTDGNDIYWAHIPYSEHNNERETYIVHCYAYDRAGNLSTAGTTYTFDSQAPVISKVEVVSITPDGYRVGCTVTDNVGVTAVKFPTWVNSHGQNGGNAIWKDYNYRHDNYYAFDVKIADHNNWHGVYSTHIYAYDASGNVTSTGVPINVPVPDKMVNAEGSTYYLFDDSLSWEDAKKRCERSFGGGHLVTIAGETENAVVKELVALGSKTMYWMGASDVESEDAWKWVTGDAIDWADGWNDGEPDGGAAENYAVMFRKDGEWRDTDGAARNDCGYIMEVDGGAFAKQGELVTVEDGIYTINMFADDSYVVEVAGGSMESLGNAQLYKANGTDAQRWAFAKNDDGTYTITNVKSGMALDVNAGAQGSGANVQQCEPNGTPAQRWYIERDNTGSYFLRAKCSNCYLDVSGYSFGNGCNMITWYANGNNQQRYKLTRDEHAKEINAKVYDVTPDGYKVDVEFEMPGTDPSKAIKAVLFPTWTASGGQDDITWETGTIQGNTVTYEVKVERHGNARGCMYHTHVYIVDAYDNKYQLSGISCYVPKTSQITPYTYGNSTYYLVEATESWSKSWTEAKAKCEEYAYGRGYGHLATIESASEQAVLEELVKTGSNTAYWIGASDAESEGQWTWLGGKSVAGYTAWRSGEPDGGTRQNYAAMYYDGKWADLEGTANSLVGFIVEIEDPDALLATVSTEPVAMDSVATFVCAAEGAGDAALAYRWQLSVDGGEWQDLDWEGANTESLSVEATEERVASHKYRCMVSAADGRTATTDEITFELAESAGDSSSAGDINGDGAVDNKDLTRLFQYLSDWDVEVVETSLDTNGDGSVDNKDLTRLFQYLSDWDVELHSVA